MGTTRRWIRQLLGLKKSEKVVSLEEEEKKSRATGEIWQQSKKSGEIDKGISKNESNENADTDFEDADWQWDMDPKNAAQLPLDRRKEADFQSAVHSPTSSEGQNAQPELETVEGWATPDVREMLEPEEVSDPSSSCSSSPQDSSNSHSPLQLDRNMQEALAARCILTAARGFLARRAFRALKGLARLQALMKGPTLKRQTAIALRCIQALVKVQARSRAKHVLTALESEAVQHKLLQQLEHEAPVKKPEKPEAFVYDGWCNKVGSARQIQANMKKREEAAAKREKAKAYALARQWQAGIRLQPQQQQQQQPQTQPQPQPQPQRQQQEAAAGFLSEQIDWGWSWLERWKAVRPWETDLLGDASIRDGTKSPRSEKGASPLERRLSVGSGKSSPRLSDSPSPRKLANAQENPTTPVSSRSPRTPSKDPFRERNSRPTTVSRSFSTPRERATHSDNQEKKRLSLPGTVHGARLLAQTAVKSPRTHSPRTQSLRTPQKHGSFGIKPSGNDVKTSKLSR